MQVADQVKSFGIRQVVSPYVIPVRTSSDSSAPIDLATLSGATPGAVPPDPQESTGRRIAQTALKVALASAVGGIALTGAIAGLSSAAMSELRPPEPTSQSVTVNPQAKPINLVSHLDATEKIIEPISIEDLHSLENVQKTSAVPLTVEVSVDRVAVSPAQKLLDGAIINSIMIMPLPAGYYIEKALIHDSKGKSTARKIATAVFGIGVAVASVAAVGYLGVGSPGCLYDGLKNTESAVMSMTSNEQTWSGHREYKLQNGQRQVDKTSPDPSSEDADKMSAFLANSMKDSKGMNVVFLSGHGNSWLATAGMPFPTYQDMLEKTVKTTGKPIDLLLLDSCLAGNSEALFSTQATARYAVISEETTNAGTTPELLQRTLSDPKADVSTPEALGRSILDHVKTGSEMQPSTLALIDMQKVPELQTAVDHFGTVLANEVSQGRTAPIQASMDATPVYPQEAEYASYARQLAVGDLKTFAQQIIAHTPGDSPDAKAVRGSAQQVLTALNDVVVAEKNSTAYARAGGLSVQLPRPGAHGQVVVNHEPGSKATFDTSGAPAGWRAFIHGFESGTPATGVAARVQKLDEGLRLEKPIIKGLRLEQPLAVQ